MNRLPFPGGSTSDSDVGNFHVPIQVGRRDGDRFTSLRALVDTGSTYSWVPRDVLEELGVTAEQEWPFELADGRLVRYPVAWIQIRLEGWEQPTLVVFGPTGTEPILGAFTLEGFRLAADPVNERLISVPGLAKQATSVPPHRLFSISFITSTSCRSCGRPAASFERMMSSRLATSTSDP